MRDTINLLLALGILLVFFGSIIIMGKEPQDSCNHTPVPARQIVPIKDMTWKHQMEQTAATVDYLMEQLPPPPVQH